MSGLVIPQDFRLGRLRHMLLAALGWSVFGLGTTIANQLLPSPSVGMIAGAAILFLTVVGNGVWQLSLNVLRLRELDLSVLNAGWILVLHCAVAFFSQAEEPYFVIASMLLLGAKSVLFLWPDEPAPARAAAVSPARSLRSAS